MQHCSFQLGGFKICYGYLASYNVKCHIVGYLYLFHDFYSQEYELAN